MKKVLVADFETTVYEAQEKTEVWAAAAVEIGTEDVKIFHSIDEFFYSLVKMKSNLLVYFHNVKFDGSFLLDYFLVQKNFKQAIDTFHSDVLKDFQFKDDKWMRHKEIKYNINHMGQWYNIKVKYGKYMIEFRDSLKLLPFSVEQIGKSFGTKHKKLNMEYDGYRYAGCKITAEEAEYIKNDVLVVKEALEIMFDDGHTKMTIGACCMEEFKKTSLINDLLPGGIEAAMPNLYTEEAPFYTEAPTIGDYIHKAYRGGWCYVVPEKANKVIQYGLTADVNSLYPSMMHSDSGNYYPIGNPHFFQGKPPKIAKENFYYIRIRCRFKIRKNYLPFIQIKGEPWYKGNENLITSDVWDKNTQKYYRYARKGDEVVEMKPELTLTMMDYKLLHKHYHVYEEEILDGCWFYKEIGIFDEYIDKYKKIKMESKGAKRQEAKLFLNNLYGKLAASTRSSFKIAQVVEENGVKRIRFITYVSYDKEPGYIPMGAAITSYSRCFTINAAQKNYYGPYERGFIYADTDSVHCDLTEEELKGIKKHPTEFNHWSIESYWDKAIFTRQKTYVEHVTHVDGSPVEPYYDVKCAGMPKSAKQYFIWSMEGNCSVKDLLDMPKDYAKYIGNRRTLEDFKIGLSVPGKLLPKRIPGGLILVETPFVMR